MTTTIEPRYATDRARSDIERALTVAGKDIQALQASDLAMLEDFHSLGRLATVALIDLARVSASDRVLDAGTGIGGFDDASFDVLVSQHVQMNIADKRRLYAEARRVLVPVAPAEPPRHPRTASRGALRRWLRDRALERRHRTSCDSNG